MVIGRTQTHADCLHRTTRTYSTGLGTQELPRSCQRRLISPSVGFRALAVGYIAVWGGMWQAQLLCHSVKARPAEFPVSCCWLDFGHVRVLMHDLETPLPLEVGWFATKS